MAEAAIAAATVVTGIEAATEAEIAAATVTVGHVEMTARDVMMVHEGMTAKAAATLPAK